MTEREGNKRMYRVFGLDLRVEREASHMNKQGLRAAVPACSEIKAHIVSVLTHLVKNPSLEFFRTKMSIAVILLKNNCCHFFYCLMSLSP